MRCAIWYHLYNLKNVKNTHEGVLLLVELQVPPRNFTKSNTRPWMFFTFLKLYYKWYQIAQSIAFILFRTDTYESIPSNLRWTGHSGCKSNCDDD